MIRRLSSLLAFGVVLSAARPAVPDQQDHETVVMPSGTNFLRIEGPVDGSTLNLAGTISSLVQAGQTNIWLGINSPGGSVMVEDVVMQAMQSAQHHGVKFTCVVSAFAMSAAYQLFDACDVRYVLSGAQLMFHPARHMVGGGGGMFGGAPEALTATEARSIADTLEAMDRRALVSLCRNIVHNDFTRCEQVKDKYRQEFVWYAEDLAAFADPGYFTIVKNIKGWDSMLDFRPKNKQASAPPPQ